MAASITLNIRLGPLVTFRIDGSNCEEIMHALDGFAELNRRIDDMCSDLGERMYPEGFAAASNEVEDEEKAS